MSLFKDCTAAIRQLVADDRLHAREHRGFFTDLDVAVLASQIAGGYDEGVMQEALTEANLALGKAYRAENVVRFGPVRIPGVPLPDHARIATRIVYAAPNGPAEFKTVNGTFKRLRYSKDKIRQRGWRGDVTNRDDREPWADQVTDDTKLRARLIAARS
jgi:predicted aminopeptidase